MEYRSSNAGQHISNDFVAGVGSSHGVQLSGGSTGGIVESVGDDTNISLNIRGKGTGAVHVGNSSSPVNLVGNLTSSGTFSYTGSSFAVTPASTGGITLGNSSNTLTIGAGTLTITSSVVVAPTSTAGISLGTSSNPVTIAGSSVAVTSTHVNLNSTRVSLGGGASTTALSGFQRVRVDFTVPELAALATGTSTHTATGLTTNSVMMFSYDAATAVVPDQVNIVAKCSTTNELRLVFQNTFNSTIGTGLSTTHGYLAWFTF